MEHFQLNSTESFQLLLLFPKKNLFYENNIFQIDDKLCQWLKMALYAPTLFDAERKINGSCTKIQRNVFIEQ